MGIRHVLERTLPLKLINVGKYTHTYMYCICHKAWAC